ncbi:spore protease YyaC [Mesobacillus selenatarsenatis]|uniref:Spore protease GPR related protein n=1 Tax=Mesobacillus selenatarsenatis (strain DSM 18680 / JCM 14380 / FERM P-15431 / SF-1) TaxID=1321606 RepID=A0A0A8X044_MESS1|nr:spore protease YyaC [Mesobacillus selenatarsenatis]GAM13288.1 spore protease GPR related protein [Mesobacillus selenatarsenatis SF-1]
MNLKNHFFERKNNVAKINHEDDLAAEKLASEILDHLPNFSTRPIVFVCIGTDRSTGDSLGPLIGTLLQEKEIAPYHVYGTLDDPIHAVNMDAKLAEIKQKHFNPFIIGIDACLGRLKSVGSIQVGDGPVKPGAGVNKELPEVGNMHITGIVNVSGFMEFFVLQNTRLNLVLKMAKTIANGIFESSQQLPKKQDWPKINWDLETEQPTVAE